MVWYKLQCWISNETRNDEKVLQWSRKYKQCIECNSIKSRHKWNWLCLLCYDKNRNKNSKRIIQNKIRSYKYWYNVRIMQYLYKKRHKKSWPKQIRDEKIIPLLKKIWYYKRKWKEMIQINIDWIYEYLPYNEMVGRKHPDYRQQQKEFELLKKYYCKKHKKK
jgi:hypothetical protein